jgi:hypothetical protein
MYLAYSVKNAVKICLFVFYTLQSHYDKQLLLVLTGDTQYPLTGLVNTGEVGGIPAFTSDRK